MTELLPTDFGTPEMLLLPEVLLLPEGPVGGQAVVVADGVFADVGPVVEVVARHPGLSPLAMEGKLIMPGFVDSHHHLTQSFGKALAFGEPSEIFRRVWVPLEGALDEDTAYVAVKLAALEALRGGFTTVTDAGTRATIDLASVAAATQDVGIRCVLGLNCNNLAGDEELRSRDSVLTEASRHLSRWDRRSLIHPSLAVSVPECATDELMRGLARLCEETGTVLQSHVNEHLVSVERSLERCGRRPVEQLHHLGVLGPHLLAAHATLVTPTELAMVCDSGAAVSYNPVASAWKGNAVAPATTMAVLGIPFGLGTDGTRGDGFRLVDAAETAQRLAYGLQTGDSSCGGGWTWLQHATGEAAKAVGLGGVTGEVAVGKSADFLIVDLEVPEMQPSWDLTWELVRLANRDQIVAVLVDGRLRLWRGWPPDWDGRALVTQAATIGREVLDQADVRRIHPTAIEHRRRHGDTTTRRHDSRSR